MIIIKAHWLLINQSLSLYHAAAILRSDINETVEIPFQSLNPRDISVRRNEAIISGDINNFFFIAPFAINFHKVQ